MDINELLDQQRENDPEEAKREAQQRIAGNQPLMEAPADPWAKLPRGLRVGDRWDTDVVVRELTGADEENLARYRRDPVLLLDAVLGYGIESIGPTRISEQVFDSRTSTLRELLIGEREQLFLAVAKATFGDDKELSYTCQSCGATNDISFSLTKDIAIPEMENPQQDTYTYTTTKGEVIEYRLVTGADQFDINSRSTGLSDSEQNTLLFSEIILTVDGRPIVDKKHFARSMGMKDRALFLDELIKRQPGPNLTLNTECSTCGSSVILPLTWELVFRP